MGGFAKLNGRRIMLIGHEKGNDTQSRIKHNFGMGKPEGYRKAIRLMEMAGRFGLPVVTLVDTSGAFPGIEAEERGQAEAIARSTEACLALPVPMVAVIVGEGGSGGAVALATANRVLMLEHAVYSVISPEGCASILWRTSDKAADAAQAMKVTAQHLKRDGVIDRIVKEPIGGAHRDPAGTARLLGTALAEEIDSLAGQSGAALIAAREARFLGIGG
jgi:acetyl-CoA carboxylase carboxyl transferase subunit alpha